MIWCSPESARERAATAGQNILTDDVTALLTQLVMFSLLGLDLNWLWLVSWLPCVRVWCLCQCALLCSRCRQAMVGPTPVLTPHHRSETPPVPGHHPQPRASRVVKVESAVSRRARGHGRKEDRPGPRPKMFFFLGPGLSQVLPRSARFNARQRQAGWGGTWLSRPCLVRTDRGRIRADALILLITKFASLSSLVSRPRC